jgi:hypothetical protein
MVDHLVLTSLGQLLCTLKILFTYFTKQATLMRRSTVWISLPSVSYSLPLSLSDQVDDLTPEKYCSALSKLVFAWLDPLVYRGWKKQLDRSDLWSLRHENR